MKPRKIRRNRHSFRRRRFHFPWRALGMILLLACLVVGGIFAAKGISKVASTKKDKPATSVTSEVEKKGKKETPSTTTTAPKKESVHKLNQCKSFVMSPATLANQEKREAQITEAAKAGFTGVVFDLKDADGLLHYASSSAQAKSNEAIASDALSINDLKSFLQFAKEKGVTCIPRVFCFQDKTAGYKMASARVLLQGEPKYLWLDNTAANGGKPWLNPYSPDAHAYLQSFIKELSDMGFESICLDAVQFPNVLYLASFGSTSLSNLSKIDVLAKFVQDSQKMAGSCQLIVTASGFSTFSDSTEIYGGNPLNFGASVVAPQLFPSYFGNTLVVGNEKLRDPASNPAKALSMTLSQINLRVQLIEKGKQPAIMPFIQGFSYTDTQVAEEIKVLRSVCGNDAGFIVYTYDGNYAFSNYNV